MTAIARTGKKRGVQVRRLLEEGRRVPLPRGDPVKSCRVCRDGARSGGRKNPEKNSLILETGTLQTAPAITPEHENRAPTASSRERGRVISVECRAFRIARYAAAKRGSRQQHPIQTAPLRQPFLRIRSEPECSFQIGLLRMMGGAGRGCSDDRPPVVVGIWAA